MEISFRQGGGSDIAYIKATWLKGFRDGEGVRDVPNSIYYSYEGAVLEHIIPRCSNKSGVLIAYESLPEGTPFSEIMDAPIIGYIVCEPMEEALLVHYVYVRGHHREGKIGGQQCRQQGVAAALIDHARIKFRQSNLPVWYTYRTPACWQDYGWRTYLKNLPATYFPYLKFDLLPHGWEVGARRASNGPGR